MAKTWRHWRTALELVQPDTIVRWHRDWLRRRWRRRSRRTRDGRPTMAYEMRRLIAEMATANPLWDAPCIHGELCKLGLDVSVRTYHGCWVDIGRGRKTWRSFLTNHMTAIVRGKARTSSA